LRWRRPGHHSEDYLSNRAQAIRAVLALLGYALLALVLDLAAWATAGVIRMVLLVPAALASAVVCWMGGLAAVFGWAVLCAFHPIVGSVVLGVGIAVVWWLLFWLETGIRFGPSIISAVLLAFTLSALMYAGIRGRRLNA
jgi:hypothetical protein